MNDQVGERQPGRCRWGLPASRCRARTRAVVVPIQRPGCPPAAALRLSTWRPASRGKAPGTQPRGKARAPRRLRQASPRGPSPLTWSPSTRWAAARSRGGSPPWRSARNPGATATSGVDSWGPAACTHFRSSPFNPCYCRTGGVETRKKDPISKVETPGCEAKTE